MKFEKLLVIGPGSIGQKHIIAARKINFSLKVAVCRTRSSKKINPKLNNCLEFADKKLLRNEITKHELRNELIDLTMQRVKEESQFGFPEAALTLKYLSTEELQLRWELNIKSLGMGGLLVPGKGSEMINDVVKSFFYSKAYTIAGGSSEVQLNIISKNILGLPS